MTASRQELKSYFANGKLPTGENFAELIDSMTQQDEFKAHEEAFDKWTNRGEVSLGAGDTAWRLFVDAAHHIRLQPGPEYDNEPGAADVQLTGWIGMAGRVGEKIDSDEFSAELTKLDVATLASVDSDGKWWKIVDMPGHPCAFEITAATAQPALKTQSRVKSARNWLVGRSRTGNAIVHAVATANGSHDKPSLKTTGHPDAANARQRLKRNLAGLILLALSVALFMETPLHKSLAAIAGKFPELQKIEAEVTKEPQMVEKAVDKIFVTTLQKLGFEGMEASIKTYPTFWIIAGVIVALYFARLLILQLTARRNEVALRWTKSAGSVLAADADYSLEMRGPPVHEGREPSKVYYHITKLWN